jgi:Protein of unknown function (DUF4236)
MTWRLRCTKTLLPGVWLNVGKRGLSVRLGPRGLGYTTGRRVTAGLPGTGLSVTHKFAPRRAANLAPVPVLDAISLLIVIMLLVALVHWVELVLWVCVNCAG